MEFNISNFLFKWTSNFDYEKNWKHFEIYENITIFQWFSTKFPENSSQLRTNPVKFSAIFNEN